METDSVTETELITTNNEAAEFWPEISPGEDADLDVEDEPESKDIYWIIKRFWPCFSAPKIETEKK